MMLLAAVCFAALAIIGIILVLSGRSQKGRALQQYTHQPTVVGQPQYTQGQQLSETIEAKAKRANPEYEEQKTKTMANLLQQQKICYEVAMLDLQQEVQQLTLLRQKEGMNLGRLLDQLALAMGVAYPEYAVVRQHEEMKRIDLDYYQKEAEFDVEMNVKVAKIEEARQITRALHDAIAEKYRIETDKQLAAKEKKERLTAQQRLIDKYVEDFSDQMAGDRGKKVQSKRLRRAKQASKRRADNRAAD